MADESRVMFKQPNSPLFGKPFIFAGLGEVLFDVFEDGAATLGGAPLNVAVHAHQLASTLGIGQGIVVSRIGKDPSGELLCASLTQRGMSTDYIQIDPDHPTGIVSVFMHESEPGYQIEKDAAWDFLEGGTALDQLAANCQAVCFGSLAQRSERSRATIRNFLAKAPQAIRLYDVNLRRNTLTNEPGYSPEVIENSCELASIMKVNCLELLEIAGMFGLGGSGAGDEEEIVSAAAGLLRRFSMKALVVTRGSKGTTLFMDGGEFNGRLPLRRLDEVHPVGAGDACAAGILFGTALGFSPNDSVDLANQMGTWVASQRSATPRLPDSIPEFANGILRAASGLPGGSVLETA